MIEGNPGEFGESNRQQGKVDAPDGEAEAKDADDGAGQRGEQHAEPQPRPWPDAEMDEQRRTGIGSKPDIKGVTEGELPGEAHHHVPGLADIGEPQHQGDD
jgi:hypothetical protein